jgi:hypothetical protein
MRIVPMTRNNIATRWDNGWLWRWWWQIGLALFAGLNEHNINLLGAGRRVLIDNKRQAIGLVTGHYRHDKFWRGQRR